MQGKEKFYSIRTAAQKMGLKSPAYARKILGNPDAMEKYNEGERFLYSPEHVERSKLILDENRKRRQQDKGKRCCYQCRKKFNPSELQSGICTNCLAWKTVLNYSCSGDRTKHRPDRRKVEKLKAAIGKLEAKFKTQSELQAGDRA